MYGGLIHPFWAVWRVMNLTVYQIENDRRIVLPQWILFHFYQMLKEIFVSVSQMPPWSQELKSSKRSIHIAHFYGRFLYHLKKDMEKISFFKALYCKYQLQHPVSSFVFYSLWSIFQFPFSFSNRKHFAELNENQLTRCGLPSSHNLVDQWTCSTFSSYRGVQLFRSLVKD